MLRNHPTGPTEQALEAAGLREWASFSRDTARAMSQENVEVVLRSIEAWNRRDPITLSALWRSDAVIDWSRARGPLKGVYRGEGEREAFRDEFWSTFQYAHAETHDIAEAGPEVMVSNIVHMRGREGIEVSARRTFVFTVENGQITRWRVFQERAEALEAVGLSE
jgi:ketosteroid isomerase-like protein